MGKEEKRALVRERGGFGRGVLCQAVGLVEEEEPGPAECGREWGRIWTGGQGPQGQRSDLFARCWAEGAPEPAARPLLLCSSPRPWARKGRSVVVSLTGFVGLMVPGLSTGSFPRGPEASESPEQHPTLTLYLQAGPLPWTGPSIASRLGWDCLGSPLCLTPQFCFSSRVLTVLRGGGRERRSQRCAPADKRSVTPRSPESPALTLCRPTSLSGGQLSQ